MKETSQCWSQLARIGYFNLVGGGVEFEVSHTCCLNFWISWLDCECVVLSWAWLNAEQCDYFNGDWVRNPSGPAYTNESCDLIEPPQNCLKNGRPDREFLYWRWAPRHCDLPQLDPKKFLNIMRNKAWALIGDSISRNHVQSLLCILSQVCITISLGPNVAFPFVRLFLW